MADEVTKKNISPYDQAYQQKMANQSRPSTTSVTVPQQTSKEPSFWEKQKQKAAERKAAQAQADAEKYTKPEMELPENQVASGKDQQLLSQTSGLDMTGEAAKTGATTNKLLQNVETPKWKRKSLKDIWNDPEMKDSRGSILANAVGTALANFTGGLSGTSPNYQSDLAKYNEEQAANYSKMQAEKDAAAQQANIDAIKAANAQKVALETKLADTIADRYIKEFNATNDVTLKNKVLNQMLEDSDSLFDSIGNDEQKLFDLATYMGLLSGDFSLTARLVQKYVPQLLNKLDGLPKSWFGNNTNETPETPTEEKKKDESLVFGIPGASVTETEYKSNPNDYIKVPLKDGSTAVIRKYHATEIAGRKTTAEEKNAVMNMFLNDVDYKTKDELLKYVNSWAPLAANITTKISDALETRAKNNENFEKTINDIIGSNKSNSEKLIALNKLNQNNVSDQDLIDLYNRTKSYYATESKVDDVSAKLKGTAFDLSNPTFANTQLDQFKEDYNNVIAKSPRLQQEIKDKESEIKNASAIKPINETISTYVNNAHSSKSPFRFGNNTYAINADGTYTDLKKKVKKFSETTGSDAQSNAQGLTALAVKKNDDGSLDYSDYLISAFADYGITDIPTLVKETGLYKAMKDAINNPVLKNKYKADYDSLYEAYSYLQ